LAANNVERWRREMFELSFWLALIIGWIKYGNIGPENRLDFTGIGPAVKLAERMEAVAAELGREIVNSEDFINPLETDTVFLGDFTGKEFWKPVSIYSVPAIASTAADK
tara:strand:+ start:760 stop:1086 length:327 start_codon:yes stop_codon:yes gene_type:complete